MFAVPFFTNFQYLQDDVQFNINYKPEIKKLDDFIAAYGNHRINLIFNQEPKQKDYEIIQALRSKYPKSNIVISLASYQPTLEKTVATHSLPHYYRDVIVDWDTLLGFFSLAVTDVFIGGELGFDLVKVKQMADFFKIKLRCFCDNGFSWWMQDSLKTFFVRPEDIKLYSKYIDTFEFAQAITKDRVNVIYNIYAKQKKWFGKFNEIIGGYRGEEDGRYILPIFGEIRTRCGRRCLKEKLPSCHVCDLVSATAETLKDAGLYVTH